MFRSSDEMFRPKIQITIQQLEHHIKRMSTSPKKKKKKKKKNKSSPTPDSKTSTPNTNETKAPSITVSTPQSNAKKESIETRLQKKRPTPLSPSVLSTPTTSSTSSMQHMMDRIVSLEARLSASNIPSLTNNDTPKYNNHNNINNNNNR